MDIKGNINKRASRRYTYLPQARFQSQSVSQGIQIRDISRSGLQFFSNALIRQNTPISIVWQDEIHGNMAPFLMVVRKIDHQRQALFRYCYGTQFFNLRQETKLNLEKLVGTTKVLEDEAHKKFIDQISISALLSLMNQGRPFLKALIQGNDMARHFAIFVRDLKDYEKKSFESNDEISQMIQKLTTNNFHCSLLNIAIPLVPKNHLQGFEFYRESVKKIQIISDIVVEAKKLQNSLVTESSNRLFYNKLELLQTFVETYESDSAASKDAEIKDIIAEYKATSSTTPPALGKSPAKPRR